MHPKNLGPISFSHICKHWIIALLVPQPPSLLTVFYMFGFVDLFLIACVCHTKCRYEIISMWATKYVSNMCTLSIFWDDLVLRSDVVWEEFWHIAFFNDNFSAFHTAVNFELTLMKSKTQGISLTYSYSWKSWLISQWLYKFRP